MCVEMDPDHIRRVFLNLFDNSKHAIKSKGEISIQSLVEDGQVHIQFRDTGSGIPQEYLDKLFTAFVTNKPGGTGLGLYLVREIIEAHDGRVSIESGVNQGTIIHIFLMASIGVNSMESTPEEKQSEVHILIVDDDERMAKTIGALQAQGYTCRSL